MFIINPNLWLIKYLPQTAKCFINRGATNPLPGCPVVFCWLQLPNYPKYPDSVPFTTGRSCGPVVFQWPAHLLRVVSCVCLATTAKLTQIPRFCDFYNWLQLWPILGSFQNILLTGWFY